MLDKNEMGKKVLNAIYGKQPISMVVDNDETSKNKLDFDWTYRTPKNDGTILRKKDVVEHLTRELNVATRYNLHEFIAGLKLALNIIEATLAKYNTRYFYSKMLESFLHQTKFFEITPLYVGLIHAINQLEKVKPYEEME